MPQRHEPMRSYTAVVERCQDTGLYIGHVPGFPGAHSEGETLRALKDNLREVAVPLLDDGASKERKRGPLGRRLKTCPT